MAIERADILYLNNGTTVDTGGGINIRLLRSTVGGISDDGQSVRWTHTQDGQNRTINPLTTLVTTDQYAGNFIGWGWALRLAEDMTPTDDTNCNAILKAGTIVTTQHWRMNMNGGTNTGGTTTITPYISFWRYNPSTNTAVAIATGTGATLSWNTTGLGGENNTFKSTNVSTVIPADVEFSPGEILMIQIGAGANALPNATVGTTNFDLTLRMNTGETIIDFAAGQGIRQLCALSSNNIGKGVATQGGLSISQSRSALGSGTITESRAVVASKTFNLVGKGVPTRSFAVAEDFDLTGKGTPTYSRVVVAGKTFSLTGTGALTKSIVLAISKTLAGRGTVTIAKAAGISKTFDLVGKGVITELHPVTAYRTFDLIGEGETTMSRTVSSGKTFTLEGRGTVTRVMALTITESLVGEGEVTSTKASVVSKTFDLIGKGIVTEVHPVTAYRTFDLVGRGQVLNTGPNASTITLPLDELPTGEGGGGTTIIKKIINIFDD